MRIKSLNDKIISINASPDAIDDNDTDFFLDIIIAQNDLEERQNRFRLFIQEFEATCVNYRSLPDEEHAQLRIFYAEVQTAYFEPENSALHDNYLDLLTEIDARMAEIMIFYDEHDEPD